METPTSQIIDDLVEQSKIAEAIYKAIPEGCSYNNVIFALIDILSGFLKESL